MRPYSQIVIAVIVGMVVSRLHGAYHVGFEMDAFNQALPVDYAANFVFSPVSFEIDCAIVAESLETIPKANVSERMGAVLGLETTFSPIIESLCCATNGFSFLSARGFCIPDMKTAQTSHRQYLQQVYGAEVMQLFPKQGAEAWFKATMDGEMEDFEISIDSMRSDRYSFYDLVWLDVEWKEPFPTKNSRKLDFTLNEGAKVKLEFMADIRVADSWETREYSLLELPLNGDAVFYALLPKEKFTFKEIREDISSIGIDNLLVVTKSVAAVGVKHGPTVVVMPKMAFMNKVNLANSLMYARVPTQGLMKIAGNSAVKEYCQHIKFSLSEHGRYQHPLIEKTREQVVVANADSRNFIFNRPFLFFIYHQPTATVLLAGQFTGKE